MMTFQHIYWSFPFNLYPIYNINLENCLQNSYKNASNSNILITKPIKKFRMPLTRRGTGWRFLILRYNFENIIYITKMYYKLPLARHSNDIWIALKKKGGFLILLKKCLKDFFWLFCLNLDMFACPVCKHHLISTQNVHWLTLSKRFYIM